MSLNPYSVDIWDNFVAFPNPPWVRFNLGGVGRNPASGSIQENWDFPAGQYGLRGVSKNHGCFDCSSSTFFGFAFKLTTAVPQAPPTGSIFSIGLGGVVDTLGSIGSYPSASQTPYVNLVVLEDSTLVLTSGNQQTTPPTFGQFTILGPPVQTPIMVGTWYWVEVQLVVIMSPGGLDANGNTFYFVEVSANYALEGVINQNSLSRYPFGVFYKDIGPVQNKWPGPYVNFVQFSSNQANVQFTDFYATQNPGNGRYQPFLGDSKQIPCTDMGATSPCIGDPQDAQIHVSQAALEVLIHPEPAGDLLVTQSVIEWMKLPSPAGSLRVTQAVIELIKGNQRGKGWQVKEA